MRVREREREVKVMRVRVRKTEVRGRRMSMGQCDVHRERGNGKLRQRVEGGIAAGVAFMISSSLSSSLSLVGVEEADARTRVERNDKSAHVEEREMEMRDFFMSILKGYPVDAFPKLIVYNGTNAKIDPERRCRDDTDQRVEGMCRSVAYTQVRGSPKSPRPEVVVSRRLVMDMDKSTMEGVLVHEAGHVVDFAAFGPHYKLRARRDVIVALGGDDEMAAVLDCATDDVEVRADQIANRLLLPKLDDDDDNGSRERKLLVYDPENAMMQKVITVPDDDSAAARAVERKLKNGQLLEHFPHKPVKGSVVNDLDFSSKSFRGACESALDHR